MASKEPRITHQTIKVLEAILRAPEASGASIAKETGLASGTLYPILLRLEAAGWLTSEWEDGDPALLRRPRRRFYRVTAPGAQAARHYAAELAPMIGRLSWT
jgi:DNA-binding PadR family transcriptional regulator